MLTKASSQPPDLAYWIATATRIERLGCAYILQNPLTPGEWAALDALKLGRAMDEDEDRRAKASQQATDATVARLEALQRR